MGDACKRGSKIRLRCVLESEERQNSQSRKRAVVVVPLSSSSTPRPPLVIAVPSSGANSNARIDQLRAVDKSRIGATLGKLNRAEIEAVEQGLRTVLEL